MQPVLAVAPRRTVPSEETARRHERKEQELVVAGLAHLQARAREDLAERAARVAAEVPRGPIAVS